MSMYESATTPGSLRRTVEIDSERSEYETATTRLQPHAFTPCALVEDLLPLYIDGEVGPASRELMAEHLAQCDHCAGYLAGAQSARNQLRREGGARAAVVANDRQAQQAVSSAQRMIATLAMVGLALLSLLISGMLWSQMWRAGQAISIFMALLSFGVVSLVALRRPTLSMPRWILLSSSSILGCISVCSMVFAVEDSSPTRFFALIFTLVSVALLRHALVSSRA